MKLGNTKYLVVAGIVGCGICCLPFLLPLAAGLIGGATISFSNDALAYGAILVVLAASLLGIYFSRRKKKVCDVPGSK